MKKLLLLVSLFSITNYIFSQLSLTALGTPSIVDFTGFAGAGIQPGGGGGTLNSNDWSIKGLSDGDVDFGESSFSGDYTRGSTMGLVTAGGIYAVDIIGNQGLMVQPGDDDFTPGSFTLKLKNITGSDIGQIDLSYTIYLLNDAPRSNSFNLSYSYDNISFTNVTVLDYASPGAPDFTPYINLKATTIPGLNIPSGDPFYLRWTGNDISGAGSRDEFALDDISITPYAAAGIPIVAFNTAALNADETAPSANFMLSVTETTDCTMGLALGAASTATEGLDFSYDIPPTLLFLEGEATMAFLHIDIIDDLIDDDDETIIIEMASISGDCELGIPGSLTITITDDEITPPSLYTVYDIADVTTEDGNGDANDIGELVDLTGVVYGINTYDDGVQFTLIDGTGGINAVNADNAFDYTVEQGDEINVQGVIIQTNGLTAVELDTIIFIDDDNILKSPSPVTGLSETTESDLITLIPVLQFIDPAQWLGDGSSFNVDVTDGVTMWIMHIDNNTELSAAAYNDIFQIIDKTFTGFNVTGIGGQNDATMPYSAGYEIAPRNIADLDPHFSVGVNTIDRDAIYISPNPSSSTLFISGNENIRSVEIYDQSGKAVGSSVMSESVRSIDIRHLPAGFYSIVINMESGIYSSNFIKQ